MIKTIIAKRFKVRNLYRNQFTVNNGAFYLKKKNTFK